MMGMGGGATGFLAGGGGVGLEEEYYFTGTEYDASENTGTIEVPASCVTLKVSGTGTGGCGHAAPGGGDNRGGGGAASDIRGWAINGVPLQGKTLEYRIGRDSSNQTPGAPTYLRIQGPGVMVVEYSGGAHGAGGAAGGSSTGGGPTCVGGGDGVGNGGRFNNGDNASPGNIRCAGGGGGGSYTDNNQPGRPGGSGGGNNAGPASGSKMTPIPGLGPAPDTWEWGTADYGGGSGASGSPGGTGRNGNAGDDKVFAHGGASVGSSPGAGGGGGGGAGAGQYFSDPSNTPVNGLYGGGGGGCGDYAQSYNPSHPTDGRGGRGILIVQILNT